MRVFTSLVLALMLLATQTVWADEEQAASDAEMAAAEAELAAAEAAEAEAYMPQPGAIEFFEIPSLNVQESQDFYGGIFGWEFQPMDDTFVMFSGPGETMGSFTTMTKVAAEGGVVLYITVEDIEATFAAVEAAGGQVVNPKMQLPEDWGFIGHFLDPHGNMIGVWSS